MMKNVLAVTTKRIIVSIARAFVGMTKEQLVQLVQNTGALIIKKFSNTVHALI
jgi:hypothetical protein